MEPVTVSGMCGKAWWGGQSTRPHFKYRRGGTYLKYLQGDGIALRPCLRPTDTNNGTLRPRLFRQETTQERQQLNRTGGDFLTRASFLSPLPTDWIGDIFKKPFGNSPGTCTQAFGQAVHPPRVPNPESATSLGVLPRKHHDPKPQARRPKDVFST